MASIDIDLNALQNKLELARSEAYRALDTGTVTKLGQDGPSHKETVFAIVETLMSIDEAIREFNRFEQKYGGQE